MCLTKRPQQIIPPKQLVDRSDSAYTKRLAHAPDPNPTNAEAEEARNGPVPL